MSKASGKKGGGVSRTHGRASSRIPCKFFRDGMCKKGSTCDFLHDDGATSQPDEFDQDVELDFETRDTRPVCKFAATNSYCRKGADCEFSHDVEVQPRVEVAQPCKYYAEGNCKKGSECNFSHENGSARPPCKFFTATGHCTKGIECDFSHDFFEPHHDSGRAHFDRRDGGRPLMDDRRESGLPTNGRPCKYFADGSCRKGNDCQFSHVGAPPWRGAVQDAQPGRDRLPIPRSYPSGATLGTSYRAEPYGKGYMYGDDSGGYAATRRDESFHQGKGKDAFPRRDESFHGKGDDAFLRRDESFYGKANGGSAQPKYMGEFRAKRDTPCKFYLEGHCQRGMTCEFLHPVDVEHHRRLEDSGKSRGKAFVEDSYKGRGKAFADDIGKDYGKKASTKDSVKGKGKEKSKSSAKPASKRTRITAMPVVGTVLEWKGRHGWIEPETPVNHVKALKTEGRIFVSETDIGDLSELTPGRQVEFHVWEDDSGLGAEEVIEFEVELD